MENQAVVMDTALTELVIDALCSALPFVEDAELDTVYKKGWAKKNVRKVREALAALESFHAGMDVCACGSPIYGRVRVHHCSKGSKV